MPELNNEQLTIELALVGGVALIALLVLVLLAFRLKKLRREYVILRGDGQERDIVAAVGRAIKRVETLDRRIDGVVADQQQQEAITRFALQKFGLVRYDAFEDMGGRLSFSAALLDDHGDGLVITSINGRTETRTYAKPIHGLSSEHNLSEEEQRAISEAMSGSARSESRASLSSR